MKNEIWYPIKKYPGYAVSNLGCVKSCQRTIKNKNGVDYTVNEKILTAYKDVSGNDYVVIYKDGKRYHELIPVLYFQSKSKQHSKHSK